MTAHTIQPTEAAYTLSLKQAERLHTTPEDVIERVLANECALPTDDAEQETPVLDEPAATGGARQGRAADDPVCGCAHA